ncbi:unnamed protein product [Owenia fusiformis]|uniref:Uncharacterized protein n=1 Tax=Owenia fusiformis TaxID=6347 RepID=A0A8J1Y5I8_OWEFU|nr:unnamed protein product [Owenia fusiformis]
MDARKTGLGIVTGVLVYMLVMHTSTLLYTLGLAVVACIAVVLYNIWGFMQPLQSVTVANKAVLITGCDTGFGNTLARQLDSLGYTVFAGCLFSTKDGAQELKIASSPKLHIVQLDVTNDDDITNALGYVKDVLDRTKLELWALVNNAGIGVFVPYEWCSAATLRKLFDVNIFGMANMTTTFLPLLKQSKGRVVNVASRAGRFVAPNFVPYAMTKFGVVAFSEGLGQEMADFGIHVASIEPILYKTQIINWENMKQNIMREWDQLPGETRATYGEAFLQSHVNKVKEIILEGRENIQEVTDTMLHAVTSTNPQIKYSAPQVQSYFEEMLIRLLPSVILHRLMCKYKAPVKPGTL